jgi:multidrug efflux system membrane fusion protein
MSFVRKVMRGAVDFIGMANGTVEVPPGATTVNVPELRVQLRHPSSEASSKTGANALSVISTPVYVGDIGVYVTSLGSVLPPNQASATISDYKTPLSVPVTFTIPEDDVQTVVTKLDAKQKLKIEAYSRDMKSEIGTGSLVGVDNQIDMSTGMLTCKGMLTANGDTVLFPNMFLNIRLLLEIKHGVTLLPVKAIQYGNQGTFVYVIKPDKTVTMRQIEVGVIEGESAQIKKGLSSGETVVANVSAGLRDGSSVSDIREQEAGTKTNPR